MIKSLTAALSLAALAGALCLAVPALAASPEDEAGIRAAALDYIEGWYEGDAARMEHAVHPELAKRMVYAGPEGASVLDHQGASDLILGAARGGGSDTPVEAQLKDVTILDVYENAASVRVDASGWVDYLQLAKWNGEWRIVNVLWELRPQE